MTAERGVALFVVVICSVLLALLGLSLIWSTMSEVSVSTEMEAHQKAILTAESGFRRARGGMRGQDLTPLLAQATQVNKYLNYEIPSDPTARAYWDRNPVPPVEAINVDWDNPPPPIGTRTVYGLLTPPTGTVIGSGRYFAKVSDNDDGDSNPLADVDGNIIVRVMGVERGGGLRVDAGPFTAYAEGTTQNAVGTIEATLQKDYSLSLGSPFTVYGPNANFNFNGNSFDLDGRPHNTDGQVIPGTAQPGLGLVNNNPGGGDANTAATAAYNALSSSQYNNVQGAQGDFGSSGPSVKDITEDIRNGSNSDAKNLFDPNWLMSFVTRLKPLADNSLAAGTYTNVTWGDSDSPEITFVNGDATLAGNGSGAGLLIVTGSLNYNGAFNYQGLILVLGGSLTMSGANSSTMGGAIVANMVASPAGCGTSLGDDDDDDDDIGDDDDDDDDDVGDDDDDGDDDIGDDDDDDMIPQAGDDDDDDDDVGDDDDDDDDGGGGTASNGCSYDFGTPSITLNGNSDFLYSPDVIQQALSLLPLRIMNWREITRELEPY